MSLHLEFSVAGIPAPKGSSRSYYNPKLRRSFTTPDNPNTKPWQGSVALNAELATSHAGWLVTDSAVRVTLHFAFIRPKSVSPKKRPFMTSKPDVDKLLRAIFDALSGIVFVDDKQVVEVHLAKGYALDGQPAGVHIAVEALEGAIVQNLFARVG